MGDLTVEPPDKAPPHSLQELDDHALIELVRSGDERGLGELYRRHARTALRTARSLSHSGHEADDVVADVFDGIWRAIRNGKGPSTRFEPYLVAAIRNRARATATAAIGQPIDDHIAALAVVAAERDSGDTLARRAFALLPSRDQQILWLTAVEGRTTTETATALSLTKRAATTLKFRAKRAFAEAYLTEYGSAEAALPTCRAMCSKLARFVRGTCPPGARRTVEAHLAICPACRQLARDLTDVNATLRTVGPVAGLTIAAWRPIRISAPGGTGRLADAALRVAIAKPVLLTAAAGVVALLPAALLFGGDPPTPGPIIVDEALPAPTTTLVPDAPIVTRGIVGFADPDIPTTAPPAGNSTGDERVSTHDPPTASSVAVLVAVTRATATSVTWHAAATSPTAVPASVGGTTVPLRTPTTTTVVPAPTTSIERGPAELAGSPPETGVFVSADTGGVDASVALLPLVDAGIGVSSDGTGLAVDVALSVPLIEISPIRITLPAISLPALPLPGLDVDLPLPALTLPALTLPPLLDDLLPPATDDSEPATSAPTE